MTLEHNRFPKAMSLVVHELRTPVTVVAGYLRMLLREQGGPLTDKQRKMLEEAERSAARLGGLTGEISELGKLEAGEISLGRQELDLGALVAEVASGMHEGEDRGVRLEVRRADTPAPVSGDRLRLSAALKALMHSALRERGTPGTVVVACDVVNGAHGAAWAVLAMGPEEEIAALIAHAVAAVTPPFDQWRGGMGMALPIAWRIIDANGGALWSTTVTVWPRTAWYSQAAAGLRLPLRTQGT